MNPADDRGFLRILAVFASAATLSAGVACKPKPTRVEPLCRFDVVSAQESASKVLPPMTWLTIVSPTSDATTLQRSGPLTGPCGQAHNPLFADFVCEGVDVATQRVEGDAIAASDLIMSQLGDDRVLLWAATDELTNGEAEGTAAMALWAEEGLEIHAVGALRGHREGARVRLHSVDSTPVLLLESDRCDAARRCTRIAQVVPILNRRIVELPVYENRRGCIGRAQFVLTKQTERKLEGGWVRHFELSRAIELVDGGGLVLTDLVTAKDHDAANPDTPPRPVRNISARRPLQLRDGRWELDDEDLWERVLRDDGRVRDHEPVP